MHCELCIELKFTFNFIKWSMQEWVSIEEFVDF